jgi:hypothetical protein
LTDDYDKFYNEYCDLRKFLNVLEISDIQLKKNILLLPQLSSPETIFDIAAIKVSYLICILNPIVGLFLLIVFSPLTVPLLILAIWKTVVTKRKLRKIIIASEKIINIINSSEEKQFYIQ